MKQIQINSQGHKMIWEVGKELTYDDMISVIKSICEFVGCDSTEVFLTISEGFVEYEPEEKKEVFIGENGMAIDHRGRCVNCGRFLDRNKIDPIRKVYEKWKDNLKPGGKIIHSEYYDIFGDMWNAIKGYCDES